MTSEDDFQAHLDSRPYDSTARLVFADWLQERGDVRAEGYRALGVLRRYPRKVYRGVRIGWCWQLCSSAPERCPELSELNWAHMIPGDWFERVCPRRGGVARGRLGRAALENEFAAAFLQLPAERRAELCERKAVGA